MPVLRSYLSFLILKEDPDLLKIPKKRLQGLIENNLLRPVRKDRDADHPVPSRIRRRDERVCPDRQDAAACRLVLDPVSIAGAIDVSRGGYRPVHGPVDRGNGTGVLASNKGDADIRAVHPPDG